MDYGHPRIFIRTLRTRLQRGWFKNMEGQVSESLRLRLLRILSRKFLWFVFAFITIQLSGCVLSVIACVCADITSPILRVVHRCVNIRRVRLSSIRTYSCSDSLASNIHPLFIPTRHIKLLRSTRTSMLTLISFSFYPFDVLPARF